MKRLFYALTIVTIAILQSCHAGHGEFKIYPLSPFTDSVTFSKDEDVSKDLRSGIKIKYYVIDEEMDRNDRYRLRLQAYIETRLKEEITKSRAIYFTFYKGSFAFNKNSTLTKPDLLSKHADDKFAEFEYINGKLYNYDLYKNGTYFTSR